MSCSGPCLEHCYSKNNTLYLLIGIIIGIIINKWINYKKSMNTI